MEMHKQNQVLFTAIDTNTNVSRLFAVALSELSSTTMPDDNESHSTLAITQQNIVSDLIIRRIPTSNQDHLKPYISDEDKLFFSNGYK